METLDLIEVASPCPASWQAMKGDERMRFCGECRLNVYNLSEMSREEAEAFILKREGRTCVRLYRRHDGTVITKDCPVGVRALKQRFVRAVAAIAGLVVAMLGGTLFGGAIGRRLPSGIRPPSEAFASWIDPERGLSFVMGAVCPPPTVIMGGCPAPPGLTTQSAPSLEPAETPLLSPTAQQLEQIQQRLKD